MATARQTMQTGADEANVKTSVFEKISYGMGDVACNVVFALTSGLITYFYTNVMSVSAGMVGMIMLISRIFDGLSDVAIGLIMDKVHSKHGRGRAWVLWMALPYGITAVALFCLPANATTAVQAIYIFITYNLCTTVVYTALNLPYGAMAPLMTRNEQDLAKINLFRMAMSPVGNMIVSAATLPIINRMGGDQAAWIKVTLIYSVVAIALLLWCFFGTKERVRTQAAQEAEKLPVGVRFGALLHNKYFILILLSALFLAVYQTVNGTCATYYAQYILGNNEYYSVLNLAENIPQVIVIMILAPFIKKFGKRNLVLWRRGNHGGCAAAAAGCAGQPDVCGCDRSRARHRQGASVWLRVYHDGRRCQLRPLEDRRARAGAYFQRGNGRPEVRRRYRWCDRWRADGSLRLYRSGAGDPLGGRHGRKPVHLGNGLSRG